MGIIMNMSTDKTVAECLHGITQNISGYCLYNIFHELRTVTFNPFPFLRSAYALISNRFTAETILPHPRLHVGQLPA